MIATKMPSRGQTKALKSAQKSSYINNAGFSLVQLFVVIGLLFLFLVALFPLLSNLVINANYSAVGHRGRTIFQAIESASAERLAVGLPSLWPSDEVFTNSASGQTESLNFTNSTDYFMYLYDYRNAGTPQHAPLVAGFNYGLLAGAGVSACTDKVLHCENNMWTIAKNLPKDMPAIMPVIISRNLDACSLTSAYSKIDREKTVSLGGEYDTPFANKAAVIIRRSGQIHVVKHKGKAYKYFYERKCFFKRKCFDVTVDSVGNPVNHPLKYLTPVAEVLPVGVPFIEKTPSVPVIESESIKPGST